MLLKLQKADYTAIQGFSTGPCSVNYALAAMMLAAAEIANPAYVPQTWHLYLTFLLLLIIQGCFAMNSTKILGYINIIGTVANTVVLVIFVIWLPAASINYPKYIYHLNSNCQSLQTLDLTTITLSGSTFRTVQNGLLDGLL